MGIHEQHYEHRTEHSLTSKHQTTTSKSIIMKGECGCSGTSSCNCGSSCSCSSCVKINFSRFDLAPGSTFIHCIFTSSRHALFFFDMGFTSFGYMDINCMMD